jgi:hypothetical protein
MLAFPMANTAVIPVVVFVETTGLATVVSEEPGLKGVSS